MAATLAKVDTVKTPTGHANGWENLKPCEQRSVTRGFGMLYINLKASGPKVLQVKHNSEHDGVLPGPVYIPTLKRNPLNRLIFAVN